LLGVERITTYYLPWITRPGLDCVVLINNIEARLMPEYHAGPFVSSVRQHDADGTLVRTYQVTLPSSLDTAEIRMEPTGVGYGLVTVDVAQLHSDLYVTVSDGDSYTATHGRHEFIERYPPAARALAAFLGRLLAVGEWTIPAFTRDQYVYRSAEHRTHLLLMNLSNLTNRIRVTGADPVGRPTRRLVVVPPLGTRLLDVGEIEEQAGEVPVVRRLRLQGNAWFNLYLLGAGPRDLAGPLSLMHVK
jgi:hypothetical protein